MLCCELVEYFFLSLSQVHRVPLQNVLRLPNLLKPFVFPTLEFFTFIYYKFILIK